MLNNIVDNYKQCGQNNIAQSYFQHECNKLMIFRRERTSCQRHPGRQGKILNTANSTKVVLQKALNIERVRYDGYRLSGAVYMSPVNRASLGHEILSSAAKEDLNLR